MKIKISVSKRDLWYAPKVDVSAVDAETVCFKLFGDIEVKAPAGFAKGLAGDLCEAVDECDKMESQE